MRSLHAIALISSCFAAAAAMPASAATSYDVDIIVFEQLNVSVPPNAEATPGAFDEVRQDVDETSPDTGDEALPPDRMRLQSAWQHLRRSKDYRPLLHTGWRQAVSGERDARVRPIFHQTDAVRIDGQLRIYAATFLHVDIDLTLEVAGEGAYRLNDSRRMRSREVHYFDHPRFGVLLVLTPS